jgi:hypothetical protein
VLWSDDIEIVLLFMQGPGLWSVRSFEISSRHADARCVMHDDTFGKVRLG